MPPKCPAPDPCEKPHQPDPRLDALILAAFAKRLFCRATGCEMPANASGYCSDHDLTDDARPSGDAANYASAPPLKKLETEDASDQD